MKMTEKCKVIVASSLVAALMTGTALPALAASPAGDVPFAVLAQQNSAVTPEPKLPFLCILFSHNGR